MNRETTDSKSPTEKTFPRPPSSLEKADAAVPPPAETKTRGYTVRRFAPRLTPEELKAREAAALKMLADSMKEKPREERG